MYKRQEAGWAVEGKAVAGDVRVSVLRQDDPDALLRRGESAAQKMRQSSQRVRPPQQRRVFAGGNPFAASEPAESHAVRGLAELSLSGN